MALGGRGAQFRLCLTCWFDSKRDHHKIGYCILMSIGWTSLRLSDFSPPIAFETLSTDYLTSVRVSPEHIPSSLISRTRCLNPDTGESRIWYGLRFSSASASASGPLRYLPGYCGLSGMAYCRFDRAQSSICSYDRLIFHDDVSNPLSPFHLPCSWGGKEVSKAQ